MTKYSNEPSPPGQEPPVAGAGDRLAELFRVGSKVRAATSPEVYAQEDWASSDPGAVAELEPKQRPTTRFLARRGGRAKSQQAIASTVKRVCVLAAEASGRDVPAEGASAFPWHLLDTDDVSAYRRLIHSLYANTGTRNLYLSALREVLKETRKVGLISATRLSNLLDELPTKKPGSTSRGRRLDEDEILALLVACARDTDRYRGSRDAAIIAAFLSTGSRASDLVDVDLEDWDPTRRTLFLRKTKNGEPLTVFLNASAASHVDAWIQYRGSWPGRLFSDVRARARRGISYAAIRSVLRTRADQAKVRRFGSHDFRRTLATELLRIHDVSLVSKLLGHKDVASTAIYDLADDDACAAAVASVHIPQLEHLRAARAEMAAEGSTREDAQDGDADIARSA